MSKYEHFLIMKTYAFLIILDFIQLVFCNPYINLTNEVYSECPVSRVRAKRAFADYTRWLANQETTNEFLVKVLDEDLITTQTKPIVAVNIQPVTKNNDKIIIGAVDIPPHTTLMSATNDARDYTRFVPPTTISIPDGDVVAPITPHTTTETVIVPSSQPQGHHSLRDDSPPAGPQFIARTPVLLARQYAPIEAVAFNRRSTAAPITPNIMPVFHTFVHPTRTWPPPPLTVPTRSKVNYDDLKKFLFEEDTTTPDDATQTYVTHTQKTTDLKLTHVNRIEEEFEPTTKKHVKESRRIQEGSKNIDDNDVDVSYNMMFYNDDDSVGTKKEDSDGGDMDYYRRASEDDTSESKQVIEDNEDKTIISRDISDIEEEYGMDNLTSNNISDSIFGLPSVEITTLPEVSRNKRRHPVCDLLKLRQLNFNAPRTLPEIYHQLKTWADNSPVAKWVDITDGNFTTMENPIYMMIVDDPSSGQIVTAKQTVMIVAGIQGRDHHAVAAAMYVLYQLIERSEAHADLLTKYRFWIIPVFNPDGYDYSMTFPHRREWTKNLRQQWESCKGRETCSTCESHGLRCTIQSCYGVNLDRNFEYQWIPADELRAEHPCGNLYAGARQLSETETRALTYFLHEKHSPLFSFIAFKEGNVLGIMYPYSHTKKKRAFDHIYKQRASAAASAAYRISNRPYVAGQTSEFLPLYAGGIEDWIDGHLGIDNTYTIMMFRPSDSYNSKLITERIVHETYAAMDTLLLQSLEPLGPAPPPTILMTRSGCSQQIIPKHLLYVTIIHFILLLNG